MSFPSNHASIAGQIALWMVVKNPVLATYDAANGTRFELAFCPLALATDISENIHTRADMVLVALINFRSAYVFKFTHRHGNKFHYSYIAEKLDVPEGDARELETLFNAISVHSDALTHPPKAD